MRMQIVIKWNEVVLVDWRLTLSTSVEVGGTPFTGANCAAEDVILLVTTMSAEDRTI